MAAPFATTTPLTLAELVLGPIQFDVPAWLLLLPILGVLTWWIGRRSLAGLGPTTRWLALAARLLVIAAIAGALAEPRLRKESEDVAVTVVLDVSRSIPASEQRRIETYIDDVTETTADRRTDRLGVVTVAREAYVQSLPSRLLDSIERQQTGPADATNLAAGLRLAVAVAPDDAASRVLLVSDGNETAGSLLAAAEAARAAGVPVDVLPVEYNYPAEVIIEPRRRARDCARGRDDQPLGRRERDPPHRGPAADHRERRARRSRSRLRRPGHRRRTRPGQERAEPAHRPAHARPGELRGRLRTAQRHDLHRRDGCGGLDP